MKQLTIILLFIGQFINAQNIALNKVVKVSSIQNALYSGNYLNDGKTSTRWSSAFSDPQSVTIDLQSYFQLIGAKIIWETAASKAYTIQISVDSANWVTFYSTTSGTGGTVLLNLSGLARYIRLVSTARTTAYGISIYEWEIYGNQLISASTCQHTTDSINSILATEKAKTANLTANVSSLTSLINSLKSTNALLSATVSILQRANDSLKLANYDINYQYLSYRAKQFADTIEFIGFSDSIPGTFTKITEKVYSIEPKFTWQILKRYPVKTDQGIKTKEVTITELKQ